jgi:nicotinate phosphoribosyltransferase
MDPHYNPLVSPLLTDVYQLTMVYSYFKQEQHQKEAHFDLFIRNPPFGGEFVVFAGLEDALRFIDNFKITKEEVDYIRKVVIPNAPEEFYTYLENMNTSQITVKSLPEGTIAFTKIPFMTLSGPLAIVQLLETTLLNLVNFASLVTTNATRHCLAVNYEQNMIEFGTRRAQGPDGAIAAAKYAYMGGFAGTSNVKAGMLFNIPVVGTHAHSYVMSFTNGWDELKDKRLIVNGNVLSEDFSQDVLECYKLLKTHIKDFDTNQNELVAFTSYALTFPNAFLALIDTFDVINSGAPNFCAVALALAKYNIKAMGVRLDSGDLAYQSDKVLELLRTVCYTISNSPELSKNFQIHLPELISVKIVASSDISESVLLSIRGQSNSITDYGVGTHLVTCKTQPALGGVYKLVRINGKSTMKLSETVSKTTIPNLKRCFRLYNVNNHAVVDIMICHDESPPVVGEKFLCRDPFSESKRTYVTPSRVEELHQVYYKDGKLQIELPSLRDVRNSVLTNLTKIRGDHMRSLNPTPYKVSVSQRLYDETHQLWFETRPIGNIS